MIEILFATSNAGKAKEVQAMFSDLDVDVKTLREEGIDVEIEENGQTFAENALIKAKAIAGMTDKIVLADDSGLVVDYLNGEPGIYSARYLGEDTSYDIKNAKILERMEGVPDDQRTARFVCAMAAIMPDGEVICTEGIMEGLIGYEMKGTNGFGYDPIFYLPEYGMTSSEITPEKKNEISHRGKALRKMQDELKKRI
ncbi:MAG: XTP/dITP diphosphatase [Lachnospiraceae bacterium]|nr:XTP/dITP diphosphatase [Lachnospiraceae bacterium]MDD5852762.1 XTP/dITP diphosphatase [Lachnospiraceae bacterium]